MGLGLSRTQVKSSAKASAETMVSAIIRRHYPKDGVQHSANLGMMQGVETLSDMRGLVALARHARVSWFKRREDR